MEGDEKVDDMAAAREPLDIRESIEGMDMERTLIPHGVPSTTVDCGKGFNVGWKDGEESWLATYDLSRCMALVIINKQRGFLMHIDISENEPTEKCVAQFKAWWTKHRTKYHDARMFIVRPGVNLTVYPGDMVRINRVMEEFSKTVGEEREIQIVEFTSAAEDNAAHVEIRFEGSVQIMPAVYVNGTKFPPPVPRFDHDTGSKAVTRKTMAPWTIAATRDNFHTEVNHSSVETD
jgi:hypothetical protein